MAFILLQNISDQMTKLRSLVETERTLAVDREQRLTDKTSRLEKELTKCYEQLDNMPLTFFWISVSSALVLQYLPRAPS